MTGEFEPPSPSPWPSPSQQQPSGPPGGSGGVPVGPPTAPPGAGGPYGSGPQADSTFVFTPPTPASLAAPEQRVAKGGGGGRWLAVLIGIAGLFVVLLALATRPADERADADADADDALVEPDAGAESPDPSTGAEGDGGSTDSAPDGPSAELDSPFRPDSVAVDDNSVWVTDVSCGLVVQVDKASQQVVNAVDVGGSASGVAIADGSIWIGTREQGLIIRLDANRLNVQDLVSLPGYALGLASTGDEVWATDPLGGVVYRVDASSGQLIDVVPVGVQAHHLAIEDGTAWVTNNADDTVTRIDVPDASDESGELTTSTAAVGLAPLHVEVGEGSVWVTNSGDGTVHRLAPDTGEVEAVIDVGERPHALAVVAGSVWVGTETNSFWRIDPATNVAEQVDDAEFNSIDTAVDETDIWVADSRTSSVVRFDAAAGEVGSVIDLSEFGTCETFRAGALTPPLVEAA